MGNYVSCGECKLIIPADRLPEAYQAVINWNAVNKSPVKTNAQGGVSEFDQIIGDGLWWAGYDNQGNLIEFCFGGASRDNADYLAPLAPFVEDGGYLQISDDNDSWRYVFRNGNVYRIFPKWEIPESAKPYSSPS